jgi:hypothetical protein
MRNAIIRAVLPAKLSANPFTDAADEPPTVKIAPMIAPRHKMAIARVRQPR